MPNLPATPATATPVTAPSSVRRRLTAILATVAVLGASGVTATLLGSGGDLSGGGRMSALDCPRGTTAMLGQDPSGPISCEHPDQPPPGVDVTKPVSTEELLTRDGAAAEAIAAAEAAGVPTPSTAAAQDPRAVSCDGDGTGGYRVQAVYAYDPTKPVGSIGGDRLASLEPKLQEWAAGVDTAINRSAALTGGYRSVRWVTTPDGSGGCRAAVLKVPMSTAALNSNGLSAVATEMQTAGYNAATRKYLIWAEANELCGVANLFGSGSAGGRYSTPNQDNFNNGYEAMYTRVDTSCWGRSDGNTEAHELTHNLGGVLDNSPNHSVAGHCTDNADVMCYTDGAGVVMRTVCPPDNEALLDCNGDDYFSTRPAPGSWLAANWNTANSRYLIGGGDGVNGGAVGTSRSDVSANPGVAGLPTQASTSLTAPAGRTHTTTWSAQTPNCAVAGQGDQATVRCAPGIVTGAFTAITTDSAGVSTRSSAEVPFDQALRAATVTISGSPAACGAGPVPVTARVVDSASGVGVYGATVQFVGSGGATIGSARTDASGVASGVATVPGEATITARVTDAPYIGANPDGAVAVAASCTVSSLTGHLTRSTVAAYDPVQVLGTAADNRGPVTGATIAVTLAGQTITTTTNSFGNWGATFPALTAPGVVTVSAGSVVDQPVGTVTMLPLTAALVVPNAVRAAGQPAVLTGRVDLTNPVFGGTTNRAGIVVTVRGDTWTRTATTGADGMFTVTTPPLTATTLVTASVDATPTMTAASKTATVSLNPYASDLTLTGPPTAWAGSTVTLAGALTLTSVQGTAASPAGRTVIVRVTSAGATTTYGVVTDAVGQYTLAVPALNTTATATATFAGTGSHPAATSAPVTVTVKPLTYTTALALTSLPVSVVTGGTATVTGTLMATASNGTARGAAGAVVRVVATPVSGTAAAALTLLQDQTSRRTASVSVTSSTWTRAPVTYTATVNPAGVWSVNLPARTSPTSVVAYFDGTPSWPAADSGAAATIGVYAPTYTSAVALTSVPASAGYGQRPPVSGTLALKASAGAAPAVAGQRVRVVFTPSGLASTTVVGTVTAAGTWSVTSPALTRPTTVSAFFDASGAFPPAPGIAPRTIAVGSFTALPVIASSTTSLAGAGTATVTGTVYKAYGASRLAHPGARVTVYVYDAAGAYRAGAAVTADGYGRFTARVPVSYTGTLRTSVAAVTGVTAGTAPARGISVTFKSSLGLSARTARVNAYLAVSTQLSPARPSRPVYLQRWASGRWTSITLPKTDAYGRVKVPVKQSVRGTVYYRWYVPGDRYNLAAYSPQLSVVVK